MCIRFQGVIGPFFFFLSSAIFFFSRFLLSVSLLHFSSFYSLLYGVNGVAIMSLCGKHSNINHREKKSSYVSPLEDSLVEPLVSPTTSAVEHVAPSRKIKEPTSSSNYLMALQRENDSLRTALHEAAYQRNALERQLTEEKEVYRKKLDEVMAELEASQRKNRALAERVAAELFSHPVLSPPGEAGKESRYGDLEEKKTGSLLCGAIVSGDELGTPSEEIRSQGWTRYHEPLNYLLRSQEEERAFTIGILEGMQADLNAAVPPEAAVGIREASEKSISKARLCTLLSQVSQMVQYLSVEWTKASALWSGKLAQQIQAVSEISSTLQEGPLRVLFEMCMSDAESSTAAVPCLAPFPCVSGGDGGLVGAETPPLRSLLTHSLQALGRGPRELKPGDWAGERGRPAAFTGTAGWRSAATAVEALPAEGLGDLRASHPSLEHIPPSRSLCWPPVSSSSLVAATPLGWSCEVLKSCLVGLQELKAMLAGLYDRMVGPVAQDETNQPPPSAVSRQEVLLSRLSEELLVFKERSAAAQEKLLLRFEREEKLRTQWSMQQEARLLKLSIENRKLAAALVQTEEQRDRKQGSASFGQSPSPTPRSRRRTLQKDPSVSRITPERASFCSGSSSGRDLTPPLHRASKQRGRRRDVEEGAWMDEDERVEGSPSPINSWSSSSREELQRRRRKSVSRSPPERRKAARLLISPSRPHQASPLSHHENASGGSAPQRGMKHRHRRQHRVDDRRDRPTSSVSSHTSFSSQEANEEDGLLTNTFRETSITRRVADLYPTSTPREDSVSHPSLIHEVRQKEVVEYNLAGENARWKEGKETRVDRAGGHPARSLSSGARLVPLISPPLLE